MPDEMFTYVMSSSQPTHFPSFDEIPKEFLIDLLNEYNKYIDQLLEINLHAQAELMNPEAGKYLRILSKAIRGGLARFGVIPR
jgi:hypothetical protein